MAEALGELRELGELVTSNFQLPQRRISNFMYKVVGADFDADWPPEHPVNIEAAEQRGLVYDLEGGCYVDEDGCMIRDGFGQPF